MDGRRDHRGGGAGPRDHPVHGVVLDRSPASTVRRDVRAPADAAVDRDRAGLDRARRAAQAVVLARGGGGDRRGLHGLVRERSFFAGGRPSERAPRGRPARARRGRAVGQLALLLYYRALSKTPASLATLAEMAYPVAATLIASAPPPWGFNQPLYPAQVLGTLVLLAVIVFLNWTRDR